MPHAKGRRPRNSSGGSGGSEEKNSAWAVEADHTQDFQKLHQFMLEHMAHGASPSDIVVRATGNSKPVEQETPLPHNVLEIEQPFSVAEEYSVDSEAVTDTAEYTTNAPEEEEPLHNETPEVAFVSEASEPDSAMNQHENLPENPHEFAADFATLATEEDIEAHVAESILVKEDALEKEQPQGVYSLPLQRLADDFRELSALNDSVYQQRADAQRADKLMAELTASEELQLSFARLERQAVPEVQARVRLAQEDLKAIHKQIVAELQDLFNADAALLARYEHLPQATLFIKPEGTPVTEPEPADTAASADEQSESPGGVTDNVVTWLDSFRSQVKIDPGLTLRSTAPAAPEDEPPVVYTGPQLVVSSEKYVDWRDLLFNTAKSPQSIGGQSHFSFKAIGGGNELGAACYMLELMRYNIKILIDTGLRLRDPAARFPELSQVPRPDLIVLTHAHLDHCGALPHVVRMWPKVPVWCHSASVPLIGHSLQLLGREPHSDALLVNSEMALYSAAELDAVVLEGKEYEQPYRLFNSDVNLTFWRAGHTLGAASISIEGSEDSFFFTGEYAIHDEPSVKAAQWPEKRFDVVVASCSGVAGRVYDREAMRLTLINKVRENLDAGGWAVFPITEIGRAQDIFLLLAAAQQNEVLPKAPIYWDGAQRRLAMLYGLHGDENSLGQEINYLDEPGIPLDDILRDQLKEGPGILLANPGFLQDVSGSVLLSRILRIPGSAVYTPTRPDSPLDLKPLLNSIKGNYQTASYSWPAHPSEEEMAEQLLSLQPQAVLLVHGTQDMQRNLRAALPAAIIRRSINSGETLRIRPQGG